MTHTHGNLHTRRDMLKQAARAGGLGAAVTVLGLPWAECRGEETKKPSHMKYAICNEIFGDWPLEKAFAFAAECGYRGIEIAPFTIGQLVTDISAKRRAEVRRLAERAGLEVVGLHWLLAQTKGFHLTTSDAQVRRKTADYFGELARFCADLGGKIMILGSPQQRSIAPGTTKEQGMKYAAEVLLANVPTLEKADVVIGLEPLTLEETNFLTTAAEAVELMELVGSPQCRLHLDCKAMATEAIPIPELIRKYRGIFVHFHANDPNRQGPGFGELDFVPILAALQDVAYRGWVSVEPIDYSAGPERIARESIQYLQHCERPSNE
jgi:sugar phosphate isomerase/epimerase